MPPDRAVPAAPPWRGTGEARADTASPDAKMPDEAEAEAKAEGLPLEHRPEHRPNTVRG